MASFDEVVAAPSGRFDGIERPYTRGRRASAARFDPGRAHARPPRRAANCGSCSSRTSRSARSVRSPATRRCRWSAPVSRRSICPAGRSRPTPTPPARCIPTSRSIRPTPAPSWRARSTGRCSAPTRSSIWKAAPSATGSRRSSPMPKPASAGPLNCFEIMKAYIEAGAAGVHFEDQLASEKKCGHLGGKVLIPTQAAIRNLDAARLAADVCGVPTILVARTDAESAKLITSDVDERDRPFLTGERTPEGFFRLKDGTGLDHCIARGLAFARARRPAVVRDQPPEPRRGADLRRSDPRPISGQAARLQLLAQLQLEGQARRARRSPASSASSARWATSSSSSPWPASTASTMRCSSWRSAYRDRGMAAYSELQQAEFASEAAGYTATRHQREVGTGYFDAIAHRRLGRPGIDRRPQGIDRSRSVHHATSSRPSKEEQAWDSVTGSSAANIATASFDEIVPGTEEISGPFPDRAAGAHRMAAADLPRPLRGDPPLLDRVEPVRAVSNVLDRPRIIAEPSNGRRVPTRS